MVQCNLTRRHGDVLVLLEESPVTELSHGSHGPSEARPEELPGEGNIDDDLLVLGLHSLEVFAASESQESGKVDEAKGGDQDVTGVAVAEGKSGVSNQVRETVGAAEETLAAILGETLLCLGNGGFKSESGGRASFILLQALGETLDLVLLALGKCLAVRAGGEACNISVGGVHSGEAESEGQGSGSSGSTELLGFRCGANDASSCHRALGLGAGNAQGWSESAPANLYVMI